MNSAAVCGGGCKLYTLRQADVKQRQLVVVPRGVQKDTKDAEDSDCCHDVPRCIAMYAPIVLLTLDKRRAAATARAIGRPGLDAALARRGATRRNEDTIKHWQAHMSHLAQCHLPPLSQLLFRPRENPKYCRVHV